MAKSNKRSWRLKFIDIDSSFVITNTTTPISGFFPCRAPKGEQKAYYFAPQNGEAIDAMIGQATADWPDIVEAKAFNNEYGCYISAPEGSNIIYPSHLGGFYLTRNGIYKFFDITSKDEIKENSSLHAYAARVKITEENLFSRKTAAATPTEVTIYAKEVSADFDAPNASWLHFKPLPPTSTASYLTLLPPYQIGSPSFIQYDVMKKGQTGVPIQDPSDPRSFVTNLTGVWGDSQNNHGWTFEVDQTTGAVTAILDAFGFTSASDRNNAMKTWLGSVYNVLVDDPTLPDPQFTNDGLKWLSQLLVDGFVYTPDGPDIDLDDDLYTIPFTMKDMFSYGIDVSDITYCCFWQKSLTEKVTKIYIQDIGYDKYVYDTILPYAEASGSIIQASPNDPEDVCFIDPVSKEPIEILRKTVDDQSTAIPQPEYYSTNVTNEYMTKYFAMFKPYNTSQTRIPEVEKVIYQVKNGGVISWMHTEEECADEFGAEMAADGYNNYLAAGYGAIKDWRFNFLKVMCEEAVYNDRITNGGTFEGNLDLQGKNSYGDRIFFPEVLTEDDFSFIEVWVNKKFNEDGDDLQNGFWKWDRIIDKFDLDGDGFKPVGKTFTIEGDRYCTFLQQSNILAKLEPMSFSVLTKDGYTQILNDALKESMLPDYDDAMIIAEPSGNQTFAQILRNIRDNSAKGGGPQTVISPYPMMSFVTKGIVTDKAVQKLNIPIRGTGVAVYAGEFQVYDPVSARYYWRQPIGDVATNLARIMDKKLGGWAPAWKNVSGGLGGQLNTSCKSSRYSFEDEATHTMDKKGVNPIIYDVDNGVMILSQKTLQDPNTISDWSFLGHTMSFDICKREIRDNVMIPQVMKPINSYWMDLRQSQVEGILAKRTSGADPIWAIAKCDIKGQNTPYTKMERNFIIRVDLKVNTFSETVTLIIENHSQTWNG